MRRTELPRQGESLLDDVDGDDRADVGRRGGHECTQTDRPGARDHDAVERTGPENVEDGAGSGLDAASQRAEQVLVLRGHPVGHLGQIPCGDEAVRAERGLPEEAGADRIALERGLEGAVVTGESEVDVVELLAVEGSAGEAGSAAAAGCEGRHDPVTLGEVGHAGADTLDHTRPLVPIDGRREVRLVEDVPGEEVRVAQARGGEADENLARLRITELDAIDELEGALRLAQDVGADRGGHTGLLPKGSLPTVARCVHPRGSPATLLPCRMLTREP